MFNQNADIKHVILYKTLDEYMYYTKFGLSIT